MQITHLQSIKQSAFDGGFGLDIDSDEDMMAMYKPDDYEGTDDDWYDENDSKLRDMKRHTELQQKVEYQKAYADKSFDELGISLDKTNTHSIGEVLYTDYIHLFQLSGMILLVAMIGAIVLTFRKREGIKRQSYIKQISRERKEGVELTDPKSNEGVKIDV